MKVMLEKVVPDEAASFLCKEFAVKGFPFVWHFHPEVELTWIKAGQGKRFVGDHIDRFGEGDLVLLGAGLPHTWMSQRSAGEKRRHRSVVVQFREEFWGTGFFERGELRKIGLLLKKAARGIQYRGETARRVQRMMDRMNRERGFRRGMMLLEALHVLSESREGKVLASAGYVPVAAGQERIDAVCRFINEQFREGVHVEEAARRAHLSVSAFSRFFRRSVGKTFTEYVNELRIGQACQSLVETDEAIGRIAYRVGFGTLANFNRRFLRVKGMSPRAWRKAYGPPAQD